MFVAERTTLLWALPAVVGGTASLLSVSIGLGVLGPGGPLIAVPIMLIGPWIAASMTLVAWLVTSRRPHPGSPGSPNVIAPDRRINRP